MLAHRADLLSFWERSDLILLDAEMLATERSEGEQQGGRRPCKMRFDRLNHCLKISDTTLVAENAELEFQTKGMVRFRGQPTFVKPGRSPGQG